VFFVRAITVFDLLRPSFEAQTCPGKTDFNFRRARRDREPEGARQPQGAQSWLLVLPSSPSIS
jgi:hypothetical protein